MHNQVVRHVEVFGEPLSTPCKTKDVMDQLQIASMSTRLYICFSEGFNVGTVCFQKRIRYDIRSLLQQIGHNTQRTPFLDLQ